MGHSFGEQNYQIDVSLTNARCRKPVPFPITSGTAGLDIQINFSEDWAGLTKTVVAKGSGVVKDALIDGTEAGSYLVTLPWECFKKYGGRLLVGVSGAEGENIVIPTIYADLGIIQPGADPSGDPSVDPELPIWQQLQDQIAVLSLTKQDLLVNQENIKSINGESLLGSGDLELDFGAVESDTKANWALKTTYIPKKDTIIVYTDYYTIDGKLVPGIKIADGLAYVVDLPFVDERLRKHIEDEIAHITEEERDFWNKKINCKDTITNETLVLFRD